MRKSDDAAVIARRISEFLYEYAPQFLTSSEHTLKGYKDTLTLYFQFLQENRVTPDSLTRRHLEKEWIKKWIIWLKEIRKNSPDTCKDVPLNTHAHLFRHAKASHWIEDGLSVVEIQFLLGHEQIETTMKYIDITTEQKVKALATLESETDKNGRSLMVHSLISVV